MALCSFSSSLSHQSSILVDKAFVTDFLPSAPESAAKVYLFGLALCQSAASDDNNINAFCSALSMTEEQVISAFDYWQELGLVQMVSRRPLEVKYLSAKGTPSKVQVKAKYTDFNNQIQAILSGRMIRPIEYNEYYNLIENHHFEPEALVMIIKYCTTLKSTDIGYPYILAVAKSFGDQGIKSAIALEQKLLEQERSSAEIKAILKALGLNREADLEERNLYLKWSSSFGFTDAVILEVAKGLNKRGGFSKLDETLTRLYEQKLFTLADIENYSKEKELLFTIAKKVTATLGLYYQNLESVVEVYIKDWYAKGYDQQTLETIATYCFKQDVKSLSLMNDIVLKFYKLGIVSVQALENYFAGIVSQDAAIKSLLDALGIVRRVNSSDRDFYKAWTEDWGFGGDIINLVLEKSKGTAQPLRYMNKLLLELHTAGIKDVEKAKAHLGSFKPSADSGAGFAEHTYTNEQLAALFDSLDDIEV